MHDHRTVWRLAEGRMLAEQLRLLLGNVGSSVLPGVLLALLLAAFLRGDGDAHALELWCAAVIAVKLYSAWVARRMLDTATAIDDSRARRIARGQMLLNAVDAMAWGALAWVALDHASLGGSVLVVAVLAAVAGGSMSSLSPVLPVFVVFMLVEFCTVAGKLLLTGEPAYRILGIAGVLYTATLLGQARNSARASRAAIELRFENESLIGQLHVEVSRARRAEQLASEANQAKSRFLAAASHDLRQPVHAQGLFLGLLGRSELTLSQRTLLESAVAASRACSDMLDTLLDFSRIEAGVVEAQPRAFHLQPLLHQIERELAPQANAKGLVYRSRETHAAVLSDPALVDLIVRNLVSNAIRYTGGGGVLVACRARGRDVALEVWDTGIGIEPAQQRDVFLEFHQLGNPERDRRKGLGLGLAIAQGLARTLGSELSLSSRPGRGSVFRLVLPAVHGATLPVPPMALAADRPGLQRLPPVRVLVVDDDETVRAGMQLLLRDWGCDCEAVDGIEAALALAGAWAPQLVVSDYRLRGGRTGIEAIAALRAACGPDLPALLLTGDTAPHRLREASATGLPLLHKPAPPAELHRSIAALLADARPGPITSAP
ncbi:ATP-binding response regulator [Ramlibacter humi]|uniref:histidine kinase n=1 Tax=Ramlibacter humi TaxID=2530451 RepID=A0A4Z0C9V7_9BURK|nr:hybrid sensor histidine kinase/response regulator [Ramlibacter humi]TFZ07764.1 response regulator [Ramlibacter humi]